MAHSEMDDGWEEQLRPSGLGEYDGAQDEPSSSLSEDDDVVPDWPRAASSWNPQQPSFGRKVRNVFKSSQIILIFYPLTLIYPQHFGTCLPALQACQPICTGAPFLGVHIAGI